MQRIDTVSLIKTRHPSFYEGSADWEKWRLTHRGGVPFRLKYLEQFSNRESPTDFQTRRSLTPVASFAKAAINDIRNSIFQRMTDIVRRGGSDAYHRAISGQDMGVDRRGSTMNSFLGQSVLTELMVMGRVGVYVDMPVIEGNSLADSQGKRPYLYAYPVEKILSWSCSNPEEPSEFQSVLLEDSAMSFDPITRLPLNTLQRFRLLYIDPETGLVNLQFMDNNGQPIDRDGNPAGPVSLELTRIPFVMPDIGGSLMEDIAEHQIALLNLGSSDVSYALKANFPFYIEMRDQRAVGSHLKRTANDDGTATTGGQGASDGDVRIGTTQGRYYDQGMDAPTFIHPSSEPLKASLMLQEKLESDIRKLVNLAVVSLGNRQASAESKGMDNQGLEAGLSFIGLVLQAAEQKVADYWSAYEERVASRRLTALIKYPDRYSLKTDIDRINEADKLTGLMRSIPGRTVKKEIAKLAAETLLDGKVKIEKLQTIHDEIDAANYTTSDPEVIIAAREAGLAGEQVCSVALGFDDDEYLTARDDHVSRIERIAEAQAKANPLGGGGGDPAARGIDDLSGDPASAGKEEKAESRSTDLKETTKKPVRGKGK